MATVNKKISEKKLFEAILKVIRDPSTRSRRHDHGGQPDIEEIQSELGYAGITLDERELTTSLNILVRRGKLTMVAAGRKTCFTINE